MQSDVSASRGFLQPLPPAVELETVAATIANQDIPILYLSRHINQHKAEYYRLLQSVREDGDCAPISRGFTPRIC